MSSVTLMWIIPKWLRSCEPKTGEYILGLAKSEYCTLLYEDILIMGVSLSCW